MWTGFVTAEMSHLGIEVAEKLRNFDIKSKTASFLEAK